jgi:hypothetical protein
MRASTEKALDVTHDLIDATRDRASELTSAGAQQISITLEKGAASLEGAVDRLPGVELVVRPRRRRTHPLRTAVLLVALTLVAIAVITRLRRRDPEGAVTGGPGGEVAAEAAPVRLHVVPADGGGWDVTEDDAGEPASHHGTQAEGVDRASRMLAEGDGGEVVIHALDGHPRDTRRIVANDQS